MNRTPLEGLSGRRSTNSDSLKSTSAEGSAVKYLEDLLSPAGGRRSSVNNQSYGINDKIPLAPSDHHRFDIQSNHHSMSEEYQEEEIRLLLYWPGQSLLLLLSKRTSSKCL